MDEIPGDLETLQLCIPKAREIESTIEDCPTEVKSITTVTTLECSPQPLQYLRLRLPAPSLALNTFDEKAPMKIGAFLFLI